MNNLIKLLPLVFLFSPLRAQNFDYAKFNETMKSSDTLYAHLFTLPSEGLVQLYAFDLNKDSIPDVEEIFELRYSESEGRLKRAKYPVYYLIDANGDGAIEDGEFFIDDKMDGLNGNETFPNCLKKSDANLKKLNL